jgi:hypothetical protein
LRPPGGFNPSAYEVKNWVSKFAFKFDLYRYSLGIAPAMEEEAAAAGAAGAGSGGSRRLLREAGGGGGGVRRALAASVPVVQSVSLFYGLGLEVMAAPPVYTRVCFSTKLAAEALAALEAASTVGAVHVDFPRPIAERRLVPRWFQTLHLSSEKTSFKMCLSIMQRATATPRLLCRRRCDTRVRSGRTGIPRGQRRMRWWSSRRPAGRGCFARPSSRARVVAAALAAEVAAAAAVVS